MRRFKEVLDNRHEYARDWKKKTGGKMLGYFEPYTPEQSGPLSLPVKCWLNGHITEVVFGMGLM